MRINCLQARRHAAPVQSHVDALPEAARRQLLPVQVRQGCSAPRAEGAVNHAPPAAARRQHARVGCRAARDTCGPEDVARLRTSRGPPRRRQAAAHVCASLRSAWAVSAAPRAPQARHGVVEGQPQLLVLQPPLHWQRQRAPCADKGLHLRDEARRQPPPAQHGLPVTRIHLVLRLARLVHRALCPACSLPRLPWRALSACCRQHLCHRLAASAGLPSRPLAHTGANGAQQHSEIKRWRQERAHSPPCVIAANGDGRGFIAMQ